MLDQLISAAGSGPLGQYLSARETQFAVVLPGSFSIAALAYYATTGRISPRLQTLWWLALPVSYLCATWVITSEQQSLYIYSAFSVACAFLLFKRVCVPPALAFALTFVALLSVDLTHAFTRAIVTGSSLQTFYWGVGGAGMRDSLIVMPALTALAMAYGQMRIRMRGETLLEL